MAFSRYRPLLAALVAFVALALAPTTTLAVGASFDCADATTSDERAICADPYLQALDLTYADAFGWASVIVGRSEALVIARKAMQQRAACGSHSACIESVYRNAIAAYAGVGAELELPLRHDYTGAPLPIRIGECAETTITRIAGRMMGDVDFETGTFVRYANGGVQISYAREQPLIASQIGDRVSICLVSIPEDCPPGDRRGRFYRTTNLRTGGVWVMPDAQHMCGGA